MTVEEFLAKMGTALVVLLVCFVCILVPAHMFTAPLRKEIETRQKIITELRQDNLGLEEEIMGLNQTINEITNSALQGFNVKDNIEL